MTTVNGNVSVARPDVARKLGAVIRSQDTGKKSPLTGLRAGKIDRTRLSRLACNDMRVFKQNLKPKPKKVRVIVLLDGSGSMAGHEATIALQLGRDFIEMSLVTPTVEVEVWSHTTGRILNDDGTVDTSIDVFPLWRKGLDPVKVNRYLKMRMAGNEDGWALAAMGDRLAETIQPDETGLVVVISDGAPAYSTGLAEGATLIPGLDHGAYVLSHVRAIAEGIRKRGHGVISVSVSRALAKETQVGMYGADSVIPYQHNMTVTAREIGLAIGRQFNGR